MLDISITCPVVDTFPVMVAAVEAFIRPRGYKTFFGLDSTEHEIFLAHKC